jgi:uncharacterized membrane protein
MEVVKQLLSDRHDYLLALRNAPAPIPKKTSGAPLTASAPSAPAPQQLGPFAAIAPQPATTAGTSPAPQGAPMSAQPVALPPLPRRPNESSLRNSSGNGWKWVLTIGILAGFIYLVRRYQKKQEEEKK